MPATTRPTSSTSSPRTTSPSRITTRSCGRASSGCSAASAIACRARASTSGPDLILELHQRRAIVGGEPVQLTPTESRLLFALAANLGQIVTTETLLSRGWAETDEAEPSYVWVTMRRLRQKLEVDPNRPRHLLTVRGDRLPAGGDATAERDARRDGARRA